LAKVCKAYMALVGDGRGGVFCANSLSRPEDWPNPMREKVKLGTFDVVLTNPPFGNKIVVRGTSLLSRFISATNGSGTSSRAHSPARPHCRKTRSRNSYSLNGAFNCYEKVAVLESSCPKVSSGTHHTNTSSHIFLNTLR